MNERQIGVILSYLNIFLGFLITLIYTPYLIRMLGKDEFGLMGVASAVIGYLSILDLGFGNAIMVYSAKFLQKNDTNSLKRLQGSIFVVYLLMSVIILILGFFCTKFANLFFSRSMNEIEIYKVKVMFIILTINLALSFPLSIYQSILNAYEKFIFVKSIALFRTIFAPLCISIGLFFEQKAIFAVIMHSITNLICLISIYFYYKKSVIDKFSIKNFHFLTLKEIFPYAFFIFLGIIVDQINWNVDKFILAVINGSKEVAIYSVASTINFMFITLSVTISGIMLSKISKMVANSASNKELSDEFIKIGRLQFFIIFLILSMFCFFGKIFIHFYAGNGYERAYTITLLLIAPLSIPLIQNLGISILQAKNKHKFRSIASFIMTIFNVILSIPLAKKYGAIGSALGTAIIISIQNIFIMNIYYQKKVGLDIKRFWAEILKMFCILNITNLIMFLFLNLISFKSDIFKFLIGSCLYLIIYFINSQFVMNLYEKELLKYIFLKFKNSFCKIKQFF